MAKKPQAAEKSGSSLWRILSAVFTIVLFGGYSIYHANFVTGRSLLLAFPGWETTYRGCWPNPFGGTWVSDVTLMPEEGNEEDAFHFDHLSIDVPMFQYYRSGFARKARDRLKSISDIRLEFSGGSGALSEPFSSELFFVGNASAAPFEAEGCLADNAWVTGEFADMGLEAGPTTLSMAWHREADSLVKEQSVHTPGVGRIDYREEQIMHDGFPLFSLIETDANELASSEWHVRDEGFVQARNRYCARKDGIAPAEFVDRHLATVARLLAALGMQAGEATRAGYRRYAEQGAPLDLVVRYTPPIDATVYDDEDWSRWLNRARAELSVDEARVGFDLRAVSARPLPEDDDDATLFALLQREQARAAPAAESPTVAQTAAAAPSTTASAARARADADDVEYLVASEPEAIEREDTISDYARLGAEKGQRFLLYAKDKSPMRVEIVGMEDGLLKVRRYLRSGWLEQTIARAAFERAERIP